ncbi:unnamed protein product [Lactuca saligna]|uniref:Uncharacterized protein n=1 Tax=Lactuca saligna TaxID=75948 RepID=A0AA35VKK7_LACSI|nr:unnamed protein product [Lactuca saligna]
MAKKKPIEGVSDQMNAIACLNLDQPPARWFPDFKIFLSMFSTSSSIPSGATTVLFLIDRGGRKNELPNVSLPLFLLINDEKGHVSTSSFWWVFSQQAKRLRHTHFVETVEKRSPPSRTSDRGFECRPMGISSMEENDDKGYCEEVFADRKRL